MSDHCHVLCTWLTRRPRRAPEGHIEHINGLTKMHLKNKFISDLSCVPFNVAYHFNDPDDALSVWYVIMSATDNHAPLRKKGKNYHGSSRSPQERKQIWRLQTTEELSKELSLYSQKSPIILMNWLTKSWSILRIWQDRFSYIKIGHGPLTCQSFPWRHGQGDAYKPIPSLCCSNHRRLSAAHNVPGPVSWVVQEGVKGSAGDKETDLRWR